MKKIGSIFLLLAAVAGFVHCAGRRNPLPLLEEEPVHIAGVDPSDKLAYTLALIEHLYVDQIAPDSLAERVIPVLLQELDPHSVYIPRSEMQAYSEPLQGEFDGIGVVFNMLPDTVIVLEVIPAGPSDRAGVRPGDRIIRINDTLVAGQKIPQMDIVGKLRGKRDTRVTLSIERRGIADPVEIEVVRGAIPLHSVDAAFMLPVPGKIGYLKLSQFAVTSHDEIRAQLARLKEEGMQRLIFDVRGNAGGLLEQAILIANEFLPEGDMIVYTEDRYKNRVEERSNGRGRWQELPLAVLIDEYSASASEILAGALQDNDRATIVGRRSFGKGLVQRQIPFPDGSAMRLTVARYYTPTGRSIQKPYAAGDASGYAEELWDRYEHNEFFSADSIRFVDSLKKTTPKGKVVYGGGGIMPDVFVPVDTTGITKWYLQVSGRNILFRYTIEYADRHRKALDSVKSVAELSALLDSDKGLFDDFVRYAARDGVAPDPRQIAESRRLVEAQLRANIGRNSPLGEAGFYREIYPIDPVMIEAVKTWTEND